MAQEIRIPRWQRAMLNEKEMIKGWCPKVGELWEAEHSYVDNSTFLGKYYTDTTLVQLSKDLSPGKINRLTLEHVFTKGAVIMFVRVPEVTFENGEKSIYRDLLCDIISGEKVLTNVLIDTLNFPSRWTKVSE